MRQLTKIQKTTIVALAAYALWEWRVSIWEGTLPPYDPVIRADLIFVLPLLVVLGVASLLQFFFLNDKK